MGTCIAPRPQPSTFSKYIRSPRKKEEDRDLSRSKVENMTFEREFVKPEFVRTEVKSRWNHSGKIELEEDEGSPTLSKLKLRRIESVKNYDTEPVAHIKFDDGDRGERGERYDGLWKSKTFKKTLDISELLNRSREIKSREIKQLSDESNFVEPFQLGKYTNGLDSPHQNYSFRNVKIDTNIKDLDIDIHIEPPRCSKGFFSMDDATFACEQREEAPNKPSCQLIPEMKSYFFN